MNKALRFIYSQNGVLSDHTLELNEYLGNSVNFPINAAQDCVYIASNLPFNHFWFDLGAFNTNDSSVSIDIWWANQWWPSIDILDSTKVGNKTLAKSGIIYWSPDKLKSWDMWSWNQKPLGVESLKIYDMYWVRLKWSNDLSSNTAIKFIGHKFASDENLYTYYPDLNNATLKTAFAAGKINWNEQHFVSAREIEKFLKKNSVIVTKDQILDPNLFNEAAVHKCAEIIYAALGKDYESNEKKAYEKFNRAMDLKFFNVDSNADASLSPLEIGQRQGGFYR